MSHSHFSVIKANSHLLRCSTARGSRVKFYGTLSIYEQSPSDIGSYNSQPPALPSELPCFGPQVTYWHLFIETRQIIYSLLPLGNNFMLLPLCPGKIPSSTPWSLLIVLRNLWTAPYYINPNIIQRYLQIKYGLFQLWLASNNLARVDN